MPIEDAVNRSASVRRKKKKKKSVVLLSNSVLVLQLSHTQSVKVALTAARLSLATGAPGFMTRAAEWASGLHTEPCVRVV